MKHYRKRSNLYDTKRKMFKMSEKEYEDFMEYLWVRIDRYLGKECGKKLTNKHFQQIIGSKDFDIKVFGSSWDLKM
jgi:hypothetical protein